MWRSLLLVAASASLAFGQQKTGADLLREIERQHGTDQETLNRLADDRARQQPGESFADWKIRHSQESHLVSVPSTPAIQDQPQVDRRASLDAAVRRLRDREDARRAERQAITLATKNERAEQAAAQRRADYDAWVRQQQYAAQRQAELAERFENAQADAAGRLDAQTELVRRSIIMDATFNGYAPGAPVIYPPVFIGPYGHP